ncbi:MAG: DUF1800 domain-containing protein [Cytophagaceae bacterium]|nr:DUF1800 domain-containing protein [Cytophagaceae bacterium]MBL0325472.1 DUF1800 domain-containing protein [Cytophagaceae bacterium]
MGSISRRDLWSSVFQGTIHRSKVSGSLDEYTIPLTRLQVQHLLRRASFNVTHDLINRYEGKRAGEIVEELFSNGDRNISPVPPFFVNDRLREPNNLSGKAKEDEEKKVALHRGEYNYTLGAWWVNLMKRDTASFLEKTTLFWHDHFATQFAICNNIPAISMYRQNDIFRKNYAGNFRTLLEKISIDGAMLLYLNGNENINEIPNENYARELMELFSLGVGNYTEQDIREAAKILTGWKITMFYDEHVPYEAYLNADQFDKNPKLFMGEVFNVNYEINEKNVFEYSVKKLIDVILTKKGTEASKFISKKLYEYFVYANPEKTDATIIDQLAQILKNNNFEFKPMLKTLFKSQHFFDDLNIGVQLKSPAESIVGFTHHFDYSDLYTRNVMMALGLEILNPPNVAGWKGYRNWVSTKTLPATINFQKEILGGSSDSTLGDWIKNFTGYDDVSKLAPAILELFLARPVNATRLKKYQTVLTGGAPDYEWYEIVKNQEQAGQRVRSLIEEIIKAPDYYLY